MVPALLLIQGRRKGDGRGGPAFGGPINYIPTGWTDYAHHITTVPPQIFGWCAACVIHITFLFCLAILILLINSAA